jgi:hypothetical protein
MTRKLAQETENENEFDSTRRKLVQDAEKRLELDM